jgi:hypothetical protein
MALSRIAHMNNKDSVFWVNKGVASSKPAQIP